MDVNGCQILNERSDDSPDGFISTVSRMKIISTAPSGSFEGTASLGPAVTQISRGPFLRIRDAVLYAHAWTDVDNPPPLPPDQLLPDTTRAANAVSSPAAIEERPELSSVPIQHPLELSTSVDESTNPDNETSTTE